MPVFIEAVPGRGQTQTAGGVPAGALAGFLLQLLIKLDAVSMQAGIGSGGGPLNDIAGGNPGRAGGQFIFFNQDDIRPAALGQMIEDGTPR